MSLEKRNRKTLVILSFLVLGMFGFGFALVPFYNVLCKTLGINGKPGNSVDARGNFVDKSRLITVQFLANNNANLPWKFYPRVVQIEIYPGQNKLVTFFAENDSNKTMIVQAIPSVTPGLAAKYLKKTECFCFRQQTLKGHQAMDMPLLFHLDTHIPKNINVVTLSYTLFDVTNRAKKIITKKEGKIN